MPAGKPAGVRCIQLNADNHCQIFGLSSRPQVCGKFTPSLETCGDSAQSALYYLTQLENLTA